MMKMRPFIVALGAAAIVLIIGGCSTTLSLSPGMQPKPTRAYVLARLTSDASSGGATLQLTRSGGGTVSLPFNGQGRIGLFPVPPGAYSIVSADMSGGVINLKKNPRFKREFELKPEEIFYIGDWASHVSGDLIEITSIHNYSTKAFVDLDRTFPSFAELKDRSDFFPGDSEFAPGSLKRGQVGLRREVIEPTPYKVKPFFEASAMAGVLDGLGLWNKVSDADQVRIMRYLLSALPEGSARSTGFREAVIGGLRQDGSDLSLQVIIAPLPPKFASTGGRYRVTISTNVVGPSQHGSPLAVPQSIDSFQYLAFSYARKYILLKNGALVPVDALSSQAEYQQLSSYRNPNILGNLTDSLIKSGEPHSDEEAAKILQRLIADPTTPRADRVLARLNTLMLDCREERFAAARAMLATIKRGDLSGLDPSFLNVIDVQAPGLIRLCEAAAAR